MMDLGEEGPAGKLMSQVPGLVKALHKLLKDRSVKTRQGCFNILTELITVLPGALADHIPALIPGAYYRHANPNPDSHSTMRVRIGVRMSVNNKYMNYVAAFDSRFLFFKTARRKALQVSFGLGAP